MTRPVPEFDPTTAVTVGRVVAPHGVQGEVKVEVLTDFPQRFDPDATVWVEGRPMRIESSRAQGRVMLLKLAGIDDRTAAEALRGRELQAPRATDLAEGTYYRDELIGLDVVARTGDALGTLREIFSTGSNDVYVVRGDRGELLLPATDDVILKIDLPARRVVVDVMEGLEWTPSEVSARSRDARTAARRRSSHRPGA